MNLPAVNASDATAFKLKESFVRFNREKYSPRIKILTSNKSQNIFSDFHVSIQRAVQFIQKCGAIFIRRFTAKWYKSETTITLQRKLS